MKYEYKLIHFSPSKISKLQGIENQKGIGEFSPEAMKPLNKLGEKGWEAVNIDETKAVQGGSTFEFSILFKRSK